VSRGQVKLLEADSGNLHFKVKEYDIFRTSKKEWSCNAVKSKILSDGRVHKWGCVFSNTHNCSHIRACKMYLKQYDGDK